jgi:hypothetical protein
MCCGAPEAWASRRWRSSSLRDELLQSPAWSRAWLAVDDLPAGRRRAGEGRAQVADGRVSVGAWADHHHDAGGRVGAAGGGTLGK